MPAKVEITEPAKNVVEVSTSPITVEITEQTNTVSINATVIQQSGMPALLNAMNITNTLGDAVAGNSYAAGTQLETIIRAIVSPFLEPTFSSISWAVTGTHQSAGEDLLVECGLAATVSQIYITWTNPENLNDATDLSVRDQDTNLVVVTTAINDYGALAVPYGLFLNYALPISTVANTRNLKISTAYLSDDGTGSAVALSRVAKVFHRNRMHVRAVQTAEPTSTADLFDNGDEVMTTLALDPLSNSQVITVSCDVNTAHSNKYTWILIPSAGTLNEVYAEVGGGSVIDYTDSFILDDNDGNYWTRTVGTASPSYKAYRSRQQGAFDSDVTLKLTITH